MNTPCFGDTPGFNAMVWVLRYHVFDGLSLLGTASDVCKFRKMLHIYKISRLSNCVDPVNRVRW
jgi:hypothetical protein